MARVAEQTMQNIDLKNKSAVLATGVADDATSVAQQEPLSQCHSSTPRGQSEPQGQSGKKDIDKKSHAIAS